MNGVCLTVVAADGGMLAFDLAEETRRVTTLGDLAPGDAVEKEWVSLDSPATPWGGYIRRFYFKGNSPSLRELLISFPGFERALERRYALICASARSSCGKSSRSQTSISALASASVMPSS